MQYGFFFLGMALFLNFNQAKASTATDIIGLGCAEWNEACLQRGTVYLLKHREPMIQHPTTQNQEEYYAGLIYKLCDEKTAEIIQKKDCFLSSVFVAKNALKSPSYAITHEACAEVAEPREVPDCVKGGLDFIQGHSRSDFNNPNSINKYYGDLVMGLCTNFKRYDQKVSCYRGAQEPLIDALSSKIGQTFLKVANDFSQQSIDRVTSLSGLASLALPREALDGDESPSEAFDSMVEITMRKVAFCYSRAIYFLRRTQEIKPQTERDVVSNLCQTCSDTENKNSCIMKAMAF